MKWNLIETHLRRGDITKAAIRANVTPETVRQYIRGNRKNAPSAAKYAAILAQVIKDRMQREKQEAASAYQEIETILNSAQ